MPVTLLSGEDISPADDIGAVPVIDISPLTAPRTTPSSPAAKAAVAREIGRAAREIGFFTVVGHGIAPEAIARIFEQAQRFFGRPLDEKMAIHIAKSDAHRGYFPLGEEATEPGRGGDLKEGFDMAVELAAEAPEVTAGLPLHGPNVWPADLPGFRAELSGYFDSLCGLARQILTGFALALELPEDWFADKVDRPLAQLRLLHYPPQGAVTPEGPLGCGAHSDFGCMTILAQDETAGLEVRLKDGRWVPVPPLKGSLVINTGDQMARWTNDRFPATLHRVINRSGRERFSLPFFFDPNWDARIECLPSCRLPGAAPKYAPVEAGPYLLSKFDETFGYRQV